jgi:hypothetical protein
VCVCVCVFIKGRKKPVCIYETDELLFLYDMLTIENGTERIFAKPVGMT